MPARPVGLWPGQLQYSAMGRGSQHQLSLHADTGCWLLSAGIAAWKVWTLPTHLMLVLLATEWPRKLRGWLSKQSVTAEDLCLSFNIEVR